MCRTLGGCCRAAPGFASTSVARISTGNMGMIVPSGPVDVNAAVLAPLYTHGRNRIGGEVTLSCASQPAIH